MKQLLCLCVLWGSQLAMAADVFVDNQPRPFKVADQLELDATIGGYPIWQGEKKWQMYAASRSDSSLLVPLGHLSVFQTEDKKLVSVMQVSGNLSGGRSSDWTDEPCKREDLLFKASLGGQFKNVNCVTLNHLTGYLNNPTGSWATLYTLLKEQGVEVPPTVLQFSFTRYSDNGRRLVVTLTINPELAGFTRETESWGRNPWNKTQSLKNPKKKKFIDDLGGWGVEFAKQMDVAFDKKKDAFSNIQSWRSVMNKPDLASAPSVISTAAIQVPPEPKNMGAGKYGQVRLLGGALLMQINYKSAFDCDANARKSCDEWASGQSVISCSTTDLSESLPYRLADISSSNLMVPTDIFAATSELCDSAAKGIEQQQKRTGGARFTNNCAIRHQSTPPTATTSNPIAAAPLPPKAPSLEDKLTELKRLFDAGLVSKDVYVERQKKLLEASQ